MNEKILAIITWIGWLAGLLIEAMPIFQAFSFLVSIVVGILTIIYMIKKIKKTK